VSTNRGYGGSKAGMAKGMSLAFEFAGAVFIFWFFGRFVDNWLGIEPWGQIVGGVTGWIGGVLHVYYASQRGQHSSVPGGRRPEARGNGDNE